MSKTMFHIGMAGWSYLRWDKEFYPKGTKASDKLAYYATQFNAVELNNTFYRMPAAEQFPAWESAVPKQFRFAVKAPRYITHLKKLRDTVETVPPFLDGLRLQKQAGPILFQLPSTFPCDLDRLNSLLKVLPNGHRYTIELRDPSWHDPAVYALLKKHSVAFCLFDTPEGISPRIFTTDFAYVRLRGRETENLTTFLKEWHHWLSNESKEAYVFFDNREEKSLAFGNALRFRDIA